MIETSAGREQLLRRLAPEYAGAALANIAREYPAAGMYVVDGPEPLPLPRQRHPAFYGSYDWHSCVEMHWLLVRLLRLAPDELPQAEVRAALDEHLAPQALAGELAFFSQPRYRSVERPYGWAWLLALRYEAALLDDAGGRRWAENLAPLSDHFTTRLTEWLPRLTYPVRYGVHPNTAFALTLALPYAALRAAAGDARLRDAIRDAARRWFMDDRDYPATWEPSGSDFLSPALVEAVLLARLLQPAEFVPWFDRFLPGLAAGEPANLFTPAIVADATDGQTGHLHGLNLSRAWSFLRLAEALPPGDPRIPLMREAAERHAAASLPEVVGGDYLLEHWLAVYAVLLLS
ncbi:MAG TPA: DUF2891 domain-containing protein [Thermomicrobiaceae bacterium]|nr:DUF2891 domain-containing protein [Thermomicrobiaceae bacterium]